MYCYLPVEVATAAAALCYSIFAIVIKTISYSGATRNCSRPEHGTEKMDC